MSALTKDELYTIHAAVLVISRVSKDHKTLNISSEIIEHMRRVTAVENGTNLATGTAIVKDKMTPMVEVIDECVKLLNDRYGKI
jgi:hypothetical protein